MRPDRREERTRQDELVRKNERSTQDEPSGQGELVQKDERSTQDEPMPQDELVQRALRSAAYDEVGERMRRQLVESMLFERLVPFEELEAAGHAEGEGAAGRGRLRFALRAADRDGAPVRYEAEGRRTATFGRIRLDGPVRRRSAGGTAEGTPLGMMMAELLRGTEVEPDSLAAFIRELEETRLKDAVYRCLHPSPVAELRELPYGELETALGEGHPYHPSYKSRVGFDYADNFRYGPEYRPQLRLLWAAVRDDGWLHLACAPERTLESLAREELGEETLEAFRSKLRGLGHDPDAYALLPVHPWQWRRQIARALADCIREGTVVLLGEGGDLYAPQQSIRTMTNRSRPERPYAKLAMSLVNTSASRYLSPHSVASAPQTSRWLSGMIGRDAYLRDEARLVLLEEFAGVVYDPPPADESVEPDIYGVLACLWRESLEPKLEEGEQAAPFNALFAEDARGTFVGPWLERYGAERWVRRLLEVSLLPAAHLLVVHGVALESHGQNMALLHRGGWPERAALKDVHEGFYYHPPLLAEPQTVPDYRSIHENFRLAAPNALFEQDDPAAVRDTLLDALLLFNLGELSWMLERRHGFAEEAFWELAAELLDAHFERFPQPAERMEAFSLFRPLCQVEALTKGRLFPDPTVTYCHEAPNPLLAARSRIQERKAMLHVQPI
ncbi:IucA/IucC family protein [Paenibacillus pasadenensis]|uniref:Anthrachelin biosynthesis protein AsbB, Siderophore synthetase component, ligase n=1 Tax=Paenibacillus pasadenensis TaxID=217090 RepID=A0A2N5N921_9BACL|nr:IucA/IucC family protein [Paenibacillus pasadenensis]PLT46828.1 Anthrachelin biosynthesis protein AsbB, Siderophore synthetase component, ligase [Paenibacillus pasadenensis]